MGCIITKMDAPREQVFKIHGKGKVVRTEWVNFTNTVDNPINLAEYIRKELGVQVYFIDSSLFISGEYPPGYLDQFTTAL